MATTRILPPIMWTCALLGVLSISPVAISPAEAAQRSAKKIFKVESRSLEGRPKSVCVIEGKWADGSYFRYETWDACSKMDVRAVTEKA